MEQNGELEVLLQQDKQYKDPHIQNCSCRCLQSEGEKLAQKNGELEASLRRVRAANRESDAERDRLTARVASLESQVRKP